jgi:hypothetical protein
MVRQLAIAAADPQFAKTVNALAEEFERETTRQENAKAL